MVSNASLHLNEEEAKKQKNNRKQQEQINCILRTSISTGPQADAA